MSINQKPYPFYSPGFARSLLVHMRPYLLFVSGVAGLAGMAIADQDEIDVGVFLMAFIPFFMGYGFGQALTDCFQIDTDSISAPYRPLVKGEVTPRAIGMVSLVGLIIISLSIIYLNPYNILWCVLTVTGLATYTYFKKNFWFAGPFYNGWIVMLLPLVGFMAISGGDYTVLNNIQIWILCGLTLFSYANFVLIGYLKDITADRATGYQTFPVKFGWNVTIWVGDFFMLIGIVLCYLLVRDGIWISLILWIVGSLIAVSGQMTAHLIKDKVESNASYPIISTVRAFILWHLAVTIHFRPEWILFGAIFYLAFELVLAFRPEKEQI